MCACVCAVAIHVPSINILKTTQVDYMLPLPSLLLIHLNKCPNMGMSTGLWGGAGHNTTICVHTHPD